MRRGSAGSAEDPRLRQVEDRRERVDAEHSQVGNRESTAFEMHLIQSTGASLHNQLTSPFGDLSDTQLIGMTNDRG